MAVMNHNHRLDRWDRRAKIRPPLILEQRVGQGETIKFNLCFYDINLM